MHPLLTMHEADDIPISQRRRLLTNIWNSATFHHIYTTYANSMINVINNCPKAESLRFFLEKGLVKLSNYQNRSPENGRKKKRTFCLAGSPRRTDHTVKASFLLRATQQLSSFNTFASRTKNVVQWNVEKYRKRE